MSILIGIANIAIRFPKKMKAKVTILALLFGWVYAQLNAQCFPDRHSTNWFDGWISCEPTPNPNPQRGDSHWIMYDLGNLYELGHSHFWNANDPAHLDYGINEVVIDYSLDGISWNELGNYSFSQASGLSTYEGETGPDFTGLSLKYVLITVLSNHGGSCYGFGEARFEVLDVNFTLLQIKTFLQGPYDSDSQLMNDELRSANKIPLTEPFTELGFTHVGTGGGETISPDVLLTTGNNAIVDWIFVEIRTDSYSSDIYKTISALVQRDGDVVATDGVSPLKLNIEWDYLVILRHRNHFGIQSLGALPKHQVSFLDFTDPTTEVYGTNARIQLGDKMAMIAGDANRDGQVNPVDKNNYWRLQNGTPYDYFISTADFNLDGQVNAVDKNNYWRLNNSMQEQLGD